MRIHTLVIAGAAGAIAALALAAGSARAQEPDHPSGLKKAGAAVHHTLKKTGNATKRDVKKVGSATHQVLRKSGNKVKTVGGEVTGVHKVGGTVGHTAQAVSRGGKSVGRSAKQDLKSTKASVHHGLQKAGDSTKAAIKKP